jgi:hypothetical protein
MSIDARRNFAVSTVAVAPSPASTGLALTLAVGGGALMPASAFNAVCWPPGVQPSASNAEIVRVESITGNSVALSGRGQEETPAKSIEAGWQFADALTAKTIEDIKKLIEELTSGVSGAASKAELTAEATTRANADTALAGEIGTAQSAAELASTPRQLVAAIVTANGTLTVNKLTPVNATAGALTQQLPPGQPEGSLIACEKTDATGNMVTVEGNIRDTASTSIALKLQHETVLLEADATGSWWPLASHKTLSSLEALFDAKGAATAAETSAVAAATSKATTAETNARAASVPLTQKGAASGVATLNSETKLPEAQLPASVVSDSVAIDMCRAPYSVTPETDITAALQTAINAIATAGVSGRIYFSNPGHTYYLHGALQEGEAQGYKYKGQLLFPARNFKSTRGISIEIDGSVRPTSGEPTTGEPGGTILKTNATAGYVMDMIPSEKEWEWQWTGIMPILRNLIIEVPTKHTVGGPNFACALRCEVENVIVQAETATKATGNSVPGLVLPAHENNGDITLRNVFFRFLQAATTLSEHVVLDNIQVIECNAAFLGMGGKGAEAIGKGGKAAGGHPILFQYVDCEEVLVLFKLEEEQRLQVEGWIDIQNALTGTLEVVNAETTVSVEGELDLNVSTNAGSLGYTLTHSSGAVAPTHLNITNKVSNIAGWQTSFINDNFLRSNAITSGSPGYSNPSWHPWRLAQGVISLETQKLKAVSGSPIVLAPALTRSRAVSTVMALGGAGYSVGIQVARNSGKYFWVRVREGKVQLYSLTGASTLRGEATVAAIKENTTATVTVQIVNGALGAPVEIKVYVGNTLEITYALEAAEVEALIPTVLGATGSTPIEDGITFNDTISSITGFYAKAL